MTPMPTADRLGSFIKRTEQALMASKAAALKPTGLTVPQYAALLHLSENPGISAAALARLAGVTPPTMNTVLINLQERGLVERTPHEWHKNVLESRLTEAGKTLVDDADWRAVAVERTLAEQFSATELATLKDLLTRAALHLDTTRAS